MKVVRYLEPAELWQKIGPQLLAEEAANNLFIGILNTFSESREPRSEDHLWFTVEDGGTIRLAGWRTPPYGFGLWSPQIETIDALHCFLDFLETESNEIPGAVGRPALVDSYTSLAIARFGLESYFTMNQGIYECRAVDQSLLGRGTIRPATWDEMELLTDWTVAFHIESLNQEPLRAHAQEKLRVEIEKGACYFFEIEGKIVSTAATARSMVHGTTVNMVYTPPEYRKKGYATSSVAELTQKLFHDGWQFTALFTDLGNPTSNSIYQKIGYRKVANSKHVQLRPRTSD